MKTKGKKTVRKAVPAQVASPFIGAKRSGRTAIVTVAPKGTPKTSRYEMARSRPATSKDWMGDPNLEAALTAAFSKAVKKAKRVRVAVAR